MSKNIRVYLVNACIILGIFGILLFIINSAITRIPPASKTCGAFVMSKRRILRYAQTHNQLPTSLKDTAPIEGYSNRIDDAWGKALQYTVASDMTISLSSLGKDGTLGGSGEHQDSVGTFRAKNVEGHWNDEYIEWLEVPVVPSGKTNNVLRCQ